MVRFPSRGKSRYYRATLLVLEGRAQEAVDEARVVARRTPNDSHAQNLLGVACATAGQRDCALAAFNAAAAANPLDPTTYVNLGLLRLQSADAAAAASYFAEALTLDPASTDARTGLAQSRAALGKKNRD